MTIVAVNSFTTSVTYVAENILKSLKDIVRLSGMDPSKLTGDWTTYSRGIRTWIDSGHLERVILEVFNPSTSSLVGRWDIDISYNWTGGDGSFWVDTDQIRYAMRNQGILPSDADYVVIVQRKPGWAHVDGWEAATLRSTAGMVRHSLGGTIEHSGLGAGAAYWRRT